MNNIVESYKKFKTYYLKKIGMTLYNSSQEEISYKILTRYIDNYFNSKFYNIYETVEDGTPFSFGVLKEEFTNLEIELVENDKEHTKQIKELRKVAYFLCCLDNIYPDKDELRQVLEEEIEKNQFISIILGKKSKKEQFIKEFTNMTIKENKIFDTELNEFFELTTHKQNNIVIIDMSYDIKVLHSYRKTLVNQVYKDNKLYIKKAMNILNKLSFKVLKDKCMGYEEDVRYIVLLENAAVVDGDICKEIKDIVNDTFMIKKIGIGLTDEILFTRNRVFNNKVKISCYRDMTYVNDIDKKFATILTLPIEFFIVTSYKTKRETDIISYADTDNRIVIYEEEA